MTSRFYRRFAVRRYVTVAEAGSAGPRGLLFELTQGGCRVSDLGGRRFAPDQNVRIQVPGFGELEGRVRLAAHGAIALRYQRPLPSTVLERLIRVCRAPDEAEPRAAVG